MFKINCLAVKNSFKPKALNTGIFTAKFKKKVKLISLYKCIEFVCSQDIFQSDFMKSR